MAKKKQKKNKVSSLILLLLLTVIMLATSTYAWFTSNETVKVEEITVNVATAGGIQISADAATWKAKIGNTDIITGYVGDANQLPGGASSMTAVSTDGTLLSNGRLQMFKGDDKADTTGAFMLTATADNEVKGVTGDFVAFDLFLKLDETEAKDIYFTTNTDVIDVDNTGIINAARVAFVVEGNQASNVAAANALSLTTTNTSNVYIWEPYPFTHLQSAIDNATSNYSDLLSGVSLSTTMATKLPYDGVSQAITTPIPIEKTNHVSDSGAYAAYFTPVTTLDMLNEGKVWFTLQPGITKIRVYFWIEGQDIDCENKVSGSDITLSFGFSLLTQTDQGSEG